LSSFDNTVLKKPLVVVTGSDFAMSGGSSKSRGKKPADEPDEPDKLPDELKLTTFGKKLLISGFMDLLLQVFPKRYDSVDGNDIPYDAQPWFLALTSQQVIDDVFYVTGYKLKYAEIDEVANNKSKKEHDAFGKQHKMPEYPEITFHGSTLPSLRAIRQEGFDPNKSIRQKYGQGAAYVTKQGEIAMQYAEPEDQELLDVLESFNLSALELAEHNVFTLQDVKNLKDPENLYKKLGLRYHKLVEYVKGLSEDQPMQYILAGLSHLGFMQGENQIPVGSQGQKNFGVRPDGTPHMTLRSPDWLIYCLKDEAAFRPLGILGFDIPKQPSDFALVRHRYHPDAWARMKTRFPGLVEHKQKLVAARNKQMQKKRAEHRKALRKKAWMAKVGTRPKSSRTGKGL
jgi:hypothetical protein